MVASEDIAALERRATELEKDVKALKTIALLMMALLIFLSFVVMW